MKIKKGDVIVCWGKGIISWIIRFLESVISGMKYPPSHIAIAINDEEFISAEEKGIVIVKKEELEKNIKKYEIFRKKDLSEAQKKALPVVIKAYLGKKYDYWIYLHWILKVIYVFVPFIKIVFLPLEKWIKIKMDKTYECSELSVEILNDLGWFISVKDPQVTTPVNVYNSLWVLWQAGVVEKVEEYEEKDSLLKKIWDKIGFYIGIGWIVFIVWLILKLI